VEHRLLPLAVEAVVRGDSPAESADPAAFELVAAQVPADASLRATLCFPAPTGEGDAPARD
jgi:hypothetical protein